MIFEQMLTAAGGEIDGVLVANDGLVAAAISVLGRRRPARSRSPVRTPRSRGCGTSSRAPSA